MRRERVLWIKWTILFLSVLWSFSTSAQANKFGNKVVYLSMEVGDQMVSNKGSYQLTNFGLDPGSNAIYSYRLNLIIFPKGNIGYCLGIQQTTYPYGFTNPSGTNLKLVIPITHSFEKDAFYAGLNYRFQRKRFLLIPQVQIGYCKSPNLSSSIELSDQGSSQIRNVESIFKNDLASLHLNAGVDLRFHIFEQLGVFLAFYWDRYDSNTEINNTVNETGKHYSNTDKINIRQNSVMLSFGVFASLFKNPKDEEKSISNLSK